MRAAPPEELEADALIGFLADGWGFEVETAEYAAVGGGSYHWVVSDRTGERGFVTADDLETKPWLGDAREAVFDGLRRAFDTAAALRDGGLDFVIAPLATPQGETIRRVTPRHTIALLPFVAGEAGTYGHYDAATRAAVVLLLAKLHAATPTVASLARTIDVDLPGPRGLEAALRDLDQTWSGGPFSEPARQALAQHTSDIAELLALLERLSAGVTTSDCVVTHGEPHAGNVMQTDSTIVLVDWDTVALAPPERDLWILVDDAEDDDAASYADATGRRLDQGALDFFRLTWDLEDIAAFTGALRAPHSDNEDTARAYDGLTGLLRGDLGVSQRLRQRHRP